MKKTYEEANLDIIVFNYNISTDILSTSNLEGEIVSIDDIDDIS